MNGIGKWKRRLEYSFVMAGIALLEYDRLIADPGFTDRDTTTEPDTLIE